MPKPLSISTRNNEELYTTNDVGDIDIDLFSTSQEATNKALTLANDNKFAVDSIDGVGIAIKYSIGEKSYFLVGTRTDELLSVNGGKVYPQTILFQQLQEEIKEETFGELLLIEKNGQYQLRCNRFNQTFPLNLERMHITDNHKHGYTYLAFDVQVVGFSLEQLQELAKSMNPTAKFWHTFFVEFNKLIPPRGVNFTEHWNKPEISELRSQIIDGLIKICQNTDILLVTPKDVFSAETNEKAINGCFSKIQTTQDFFEMRNNVIGKYSERPFYWVIEQDALVNTSQYGRPILDAQGEQVAKEFFDSAHIENSIVKPAQEARRQNLLEGAPQNIQFSQIKGNVVNNNVEEQQNIVHDSSKAGEMGYRAM
jgi:hypothetical protein